MFMFCSSGKEILVLKMMNAVLTDAMIQMLDDNANANAKGR